MTLKNRLFLYLQNLLPQQLLSRFFGFLAQRRWQVVKNWAVGWFVRHYRVNLQESLHANIKQFEHFNAFFTRQLKPNARPLAKTANAILSPVDGQISELGAIEQGQLLQAKGVHYSLSDLLADYQQAEIFSSGSFFTAYLAPKDYHRVHMPIEGKLKKMFHVPGRLFSVNPVSVAGIPGLFARNERVICLFDTAVGPMAVIFVGAMIVGSIATSWHGAVYKTNSIISCWDYSQNSIHLSAGAEVGHFQLGSTVILLFANRSASWLDSLKANDDIKMGQMIGQIEPSINSTSGQTQAEIITV